MGMDYDAYDDGLQAWLAGNPGWPGWPVPQPASTTLDVAILSEGSHLHGRAHALAGEAARRAAAGDAPGARRADELLRAMLEELSA